MQGARLVLSWCFLGGWSELGRWSSSPKGRDGPIALNLMALRFGDCRSSDNWHRSRRQRGNRTVQDQVVRALTVDLMVGACDVKACDVTLAAVVS